MSKIQQILQTVVEVYSLVSILVGFFYLVFLYLRIVDKRNSDGTSSLFLGFMITVLVVILGVIFINNKVTGVLFLKIVGTIGMWNGCWIASLILHKKYGTSRLINLLVKVPIGTVYLLLAVSALGVTISTVIQIVPLL